MGRIKDSGEELSLQPADLWQEGKIKYAWPEDNRNRLTMMGKIDHVREIERLLRNALSRIRRSFRKNYPF